MSRTAERAAIGLRAHSGWAALVAVRGPANAPAVVDRRRIELAGPDLPNQPYHEAERLRLAEAKDLLKRCAEGSRRLAASGMRAARLGVEKTGLEVRACGLLLASGRALPELPAVLASHALIHTADGEHFRDALRRAATAEKLSLVEIPEKEVWDRAAEKLGASAGSLRRRVAEMGESLGPPWTADQKLAALVAWTALAS